MSWFIGIAGTNQSIKKELKAIYPPAVIEVETPAFFLAGGGLESTTHFQQHEDNKAGWVASGIGISSGGNPHIFNQSQWNAVIYKGADHLHQLNGHFAVAKWDKQKVELITDQLGMRNIFIHEGNGFVVFSTRLDWLMKLVPGSTINWEQFGSRWLAINQFSSQSFVNGIERLSQGGRAVVTNKILEITNRRWTYTARDTGPETFKKSLFKFTTLPLQENRKLSLGLSGGLDSRTLFATLMKNPEADWGLHTFGEPSHPDLHTAKELNRSYGKKHHVFHEEIPPAQVLEKLIPGFVGQTLFTSVPSHLVGFQAYQKIKALNLAVVDGGFGEIARRRFMVSILLRAKNALLKKDADALMPYLRLNRGDFFTPECNKLMLKGFRNELRQEMEAMPETSETGLENWLDLFSIRTRVPNGAGPEQARSDAELFNYMPFLQPGLIQQALNLPLGYRKNAWLFRKIIREQAPKLQKTALVKGDITYPYWMKDLSSAGWMRIKQKFGFQYTSSRPAEFLYTLEEYVKDLYHSQSAKEYAPYDRKKISRLINGFYDEKNTGLAGELNWWLAFEALRNL